MGVVYEVIDRSRNERMALKTLRRLDRDTLLRFKTEFRALQGIEHPNLIHLGELIEERGVWCFTMELVRGVDFLSNVHASATVAETVSALGPASRSVPTSCDEASTRAVDLPRLRSALVQLARGLHALHRAGKVHRDIKPSNILVTEEGRAVLLDFGLVADEHGDGTIAGTAGYMAPEQLAGEPPRPGADWYAVGVLLHQALTGRLPAEQPELDPQLPADLSELCRDLLARDAAQRPHGEAVLARLCERRSNRSDGGTLPSGRAGLAPFVGRARELERLHQLYDSTLTGHSAVTVVHGPSGVGKSALIDEFIAALRKRAPPLLVLKGRCFERESVPYKAIDGVMDALDRHLRTLPSGDEARPSQDELALVGQLFPVLVRRRAVGGVLEPAHRDVRARVFAVMRSWFARLAARRPLVVVIDDLHWTDADSMALLAELTRDPGAPPVTWLLTSRSAEPPHGTLPSSVHRLAIERLLPDEAHELAERWLAGTKVQPATARTVATLGEGHPLLIEELARQHCRRGDVPPIHLVKDALWSRIERLEPPARQLLDLLAVADGPVTHEIVRSALDWTPATFTRWQAVLRLANLARPARLGGFDAIEPFHDQVRETLRDHLQAAARRDTHLRLAVALENSGHADPEALAVNWLGAGEPARAARHARAAAMQADQALAFSRAVRLWRVAVDSSPDEPRARGELLTCLARALLNAGFEGEAGQAFLDAARLHDGTAALTLRRHSCSPVGSMRAFGCCRTHCLRSACGCPTAARGLSPPCSASDCACGIVALASAHGPATTCQSRTRLASTCAGLRRADSRCSTVHELPTSEWCRYGSLWNLATPPALRWRQRSTQHSRAPRAVARRPSTRSISPSRLRARRETPMSSPRRRSVPAISSSTAGAGRHRTSCSTRPSRCSASIARPSAGASARRSWRSCGATLTWGGSTTFRGVSPRECVKRANTAIPQRSSAFLSA
jgi:serine/threonine protein kinase